ncbi:hypothetical protein MMC11_007017 [Xylographa trunciseda]|nr:hypothetical protein [Xylographa trunciseda]
MANRQVEERLEESRSESTICPTATSTTLSPDTEAALVAQSTAWTVVTTVQAVQEQFPRLVITQATPRHVEFADQVSLKLGESPRTSVFGDSTQVDPSYSGPPGPEDPLPSVSKPSSAPALAPAPTEKKVHEYTHCSECEPSSPDYEGCDHPEDLPNTLTDPFKPTSPPYNSLDRSLRFVGDPQLRLKMLRTGALSALFTDNLDEAVKGIFISTLGGNIIAKDAVMSNLKVKRACALGALTWRVNRSLALGEDSAQIARVQSLKTMNTEVTSTNRLKSMVVDLEGEMVAFEYIKEGLLVGVFGEKVEVKVDTKVNDAGKADDDGEADDAEDAVNANSNGNADSAEQDTSMKSSQSQDESSESERGISDEGEPKWKDIKDKAAATAEYLRDELQNFKMPAGLEGLE